MTDNNRNSQQEPNRPLADTDIAKEYEETVFAETGHIPAELRKTRVLPMVLLLLMLAVVGYLVLDTWLFLNTTPEEPGKNVTIQIRPGASFVKVANQLKKAGVITDTKRFRLLGIYHDKLGAVKAGEFMVNTGWKPERVLQEIVSGSPVVYKLSIREGLPWWEVAKLIESAGFAKFEDFRAVIHDPAFLRAKNIPFSSAEGYLFPETYMLQRPLEMNKASARAVADVMVDMFYTKVQSLWPRTDIASAEGTGGTVNGTVSGTVNGTVAVAGDESISGAMPAPDELGRLVILASLVEKETGLVSEQERIAGVYAARLRRGMLMQCDPTVIYGLGVSFDGNLTRAHLQDSSNPYNTYRHRGLPPGPICSPGLGAIAAAVRPEKHNFLYFVSRGDGSHHFSATLREHNNAVRKYQLGK
ncbi:endolytic transglycosylase MltG [Oleidesulfovibrio sp.]|uniref:endolytic transglycosylase MltG n=1 Tax=Oleidesulfovibrio sp. TaxID=2909707 RepID=UPI003A8A7912